MQQFSLRVTAVLAGALLLAACSDQPTAPGVAESTAPAFAAGGQGNQNGKANGPSSLDLIEDDYASGLLDKENAHARTGAGAASPGAPDLAESWNGRTLQFARPVAPGFLVSWVPARLSARSATSAIRRSVPAGSDRGW